MIVIRASGRGYFYLYHDNDEIKYKGKDLEIIQYRKSDNNVVSHNDTLVPSISYSSMNVNNITSLNEAIKKLYSIKYIFMDQTIDFDGRGMFNPNAFKYINSDCIGILLGTEWKIFTFYNNYFECHVNNKHVFRTYYKDFSEQNIVKLNRIVVRKSLIAELNYIQNAKYNTNIRMLRIHPLYERHNYNEIKHCIKTILKDIS